MITRAFSVFALAALAACAYVPTAPTPVFETGPDRSPVQLAIRIVGPDGWVTDRLFVLVIAYDASGAETNALVSCDSSDGVFEPRQFETASRGGVPVRGVKAGSVLTCRHEGIETQYLVTPLDWRVICCGGPLPPAPPLPKPTPPAPAPPAPAPGSGGN